MTDEAVEARDTGPPSKKIVFYKAGSLLVQAIGKPAFLKPEGNREIPNWKHIVTSDVVRYDASSGTVETLMCIYIPFVTELER